MFKALLFCAFASLIRGQNEGPTVQTNIGTVRGAKAADGDYISFYGIKYAGAPTGDNRFKTAPPPPTYPGIFSAVESGITCAHPTQKGLVGVEDCLVLDIHTKDLITPKAVMVWLTGEEYTTTSNVPPSFKNLVERDIVVVRLNYRLSIFGFLCLGVTDAPGNAGLKDVIKGLKWIRINIERFGGNPDNIIISGHGSGAAMVDLITLSPQSEGLIHKAIALSGSGLAPWAVAYQPVQYAEALGATLGYSGETREDLAKHLITTDITLLVSSMQEFKLLNSTPLFAPCIENAKLNPNDTFLDEAPINIIRNGSYRKVPYLSGYTNLEGSVRAEQAVYDNWLQKMQNNFTQFLPVDLTPGSNLTAVEKSIRQFYFSEKSVDMETIRDYLEYFGDTMYFVPTVRSVSERALTSPSNVYLFEFAHNGSYNSDWTTPEVPIIGAPHGIILKYLFNFDLNNADTPHARSLQDNIVNFTYTGVPISDRSVTWQPVTNGSVFYILYSGYDHAANATVATETIRADPHSTEVKFWNELYDKYYKAPSPVSATGQIVGLFSLVILSQIYIRFV